MSTPKTLRTALQPRRARKQPRVLNYIKCRFCRDPKVKTKCVWDEGSWPSKCRRCKERGLDCSHPRHKAEERSMDSQNTTISPAVITDEVSTMICDPSARVQSIPSQSTSSGAHALADTSENRQENHRFAHLSDEERERIVLLLLPLREMVLMAYKEIKAVVIDLYDKISSGLFWETFGRHLLEDRREYHVFAIYIQEVVEDLAPYGRLGMKAALDLSHSFNSTATEIFDSSDLETTQVQMNAYAAQGHSGMAVMLFVYLLLELDKFDWDPDSFLDPSHVAERFDFDHWFEDFPVKMQELVCNTGLFDKASSGMRARLQSGPLFIPKKLIKLPAIRSFAQTTTVKDFLGRPVALLEYDAGISLDASDFTEDTPDLLGRTILHTACFRNDMTTVGLLKERELIHNAKMDGGLSPLHIVAITGDVRIFSLLCDEYSRKECLTKALNERDDYGYDFLEWAVLGGSHEIIDLYLSTHRFQWRQDGFIGQGGTPIYTTNRVVSLFCDALAFEQDEVVRVISMHLDSPNFWDDKHRTLLWWACVYGRTRPIRSLLKLGSTHVPDFEGRTPLMEASRRGYVEVLHALLYPNLDEGVQATPLDLPDVWATDILGKTAKDWAKENGHQDCVKILSDWMYASN